MTGSLRWDTTLAEDFAGLSTAVLALDAVHWEALGATFTMDESNPDWPQRIATCSTSTMLEGVPFAIVDEDDVTTLLIGGAGERLRTVRGLAVLHEFAALGLIDVGDILQAGIGDIDWRTSGPTRSPGARSTGVTAEEVLAEIRGQLEKIKVDRHRPDADAVSPSDDAIRERA